MINSDWATVCGAYCGNCEELDACGGCKARVARMDGGCEQYRCCVERKLEHCGLCGDFPCERINVACSRVPADVYERNRDWVIRALRRRAQVGTRAWLREVQISAGAD